MPVLLDPATMPPGNTAGTAAAVRDHDGASHQLIDNRPKRRGGGSPHLIDERPLSSTHWLPLADRTAAPAGVRPDLSRRTNRAARAKSIDQCAPILIKLPSADISALQAAQLRSYARWLHLRPDMREARALRSFVRLL
ncbi:MAG TPA: hypothetical protein VGQ93_12145 [Lysobacter sp.]|jgi:hypothetical protein|nr:hypothetical protein [Lysobacter sp.]